MCFDFSHIWLAYASSPCNSHLTEQHLTIEDAFIYIYINANILLNKIFPRIGNPGRVDYIRGSESVKTDLFCHVSVSMYRSPDRHDYVMYHLSLLYVGAAIIDRGREILISTYHGTIQDNVYIYCMVFM